MFRNVSKRLVYLSSVLLFAGIAKTLCIQYIYTQGAGGGGISLITVLPSYLGMACAVFFRETPANRRHQKKPGDYKAGIDQDLLKPEIFESKKSSGRTGESNVPYILISGLSFADWLGNVFGAVGIFLVGSGIFQVVYASVVVFTALLSSMVLSKTLNPSQWFAVILVAAGLAISAMDAVGSKTGGELLMGIIFSLISTISFSLNYVFSEKVMKDVGELGPRWLCALTGFFGSSYTIIFINLYTLPNWDLLIESKVAEANGNWNYIGMAWTTQVMMSFLFSFTYFEIIKESGSLTTGILQGLRAVGVFAFSSLFFCSQMPNTCFSMWKSISSFVVCAGVVVFSMSSGSKKFQKADPSLEL